MYEYKPWTGAFIRKIKDLGVDNPNFDDLRKIYIYDAVMSNDYYITMEEQMYVFLIKFFDEVKDNFEVGYACPVCNNENTTIFTKQDFSFVSASYDDIEFSFEGKEYKFIMDEPIMKTTLREICDELPKNMDKIYMEFLFSVKEIWEDGEKKEIPNIQEFLDGFLQDLPIKTHNSILHKFREMRPKFRCDKKCVCTNCSNEINVILNDELPNTIIDELI